MRAGDWRVNRSPSMLPGARQALYAEVRAKAMRALGGKCCRCGFNDPRALQIDHRLSDGASDRRGASGTKGNSGATFFYNVLKQIDSGRYQLLCANCNWIKRAEAAEVPRIYAPDHQFPTAPPHRRVFKEKLCACGRPYLPTNGRQIRCAPSCVKG